MLCFDRFLCTSEEVEDRDSMILFCPTGGVDFLLPIAISLFSLQGGGHTHTHTQVTLRSQFRPGVDKLRPRGRMRPVKLFSPANYISNK